MSGNRFVVVGAAPLVRDALVAVICDACADAEIVYSGASASEAVVVARRTPVAVAVVDLDPHLADGRAPLLPVAELVGAGAAVVVLSPTADPVRLRAVGEAGALGVVTMRTPTGEIRDAIAAALAGEPFVASDATMHLATADVPTVRLSPRERTAVILYVSGLKLDAVAQRMGVKPTTAGEYIKRVREKYRRAGISVPTKTDLYRRAREEGLVA